MQDCQVGEASSLEAECSTPCTTDNKDQIKNDLGTKRTRGFTRNTEQYYEQQPRKSSKVKGLSPTEDASTDTENTSVHVSKFFQMEMENLIVHEQYKEELHNIVMPKLGKSNNNENRPAIEIGLSITPSGENLKTTINPDTSEDETII